jgi:hypothetical protein
VFDIGSQPYAAAAAPILGALARLHRWLTNCTIRMSAQTTTIITISVIILRLPPAFSKWEAHGAINRRLALWEADAERSASLDSAGAAPDTSSARKPVSRICKPPSRRKPHCPRSRQPTGLLASARRRLLAAEHSPSRSISPHRVRPWPLSHRRGTHASPDSLESTTEQ